MEKENKNLKIMLIIFITLSVILGGFILYDKVLKRENENNESEDNKLIDTFSLDENKSYAGSGKVRVKGYPNIIQMPIDICYSDNCDDIPTQDYVMFKVTETANNDFIKYIKKSKGNLFFDEGAIGIGCLKNNKISYYNAADEFYDGNSYYKEFELNLNDTNKIMNANSSNPISLDLEILPNNHPEGTDVTCYSFVSHIEVAK